MTLLVGHEFFCFLKGTTVDAARGIVEGIESQVGKTLSLCMPLPSAKDAMARAISEIESMKM